MYTQRLDVEGLLRGGADPFDGVVQYARTKRALVVLNELLAERLSGNGITFSAMHPGWADTPAVRTSLPRFRQAMQGRLRTPEEGADTVIWMAVCPRLEGETGRFYFDRAPRPTHLVPWTKETSRDRRRVVRLLNRLLKIR
jgi:NAD(P)-dependent dehydrogenase (short-subunit alcohol dehydrogenase family)